VGYVTGEAKELPLRPVFDRRIKLEFHGAKITSDGGLLAYRELDEALGLTDIAITKLLDGRPGKNTRHKLSGLFRQAVFGRLAGYEDVNDAERLACDPAMRAIVGRDGFNRAAASSSQMGRFETEWLATDANLEALTDLSGTWIDGVHARKPPPTAAQKRTFHHFGLGPLAAVSRCSELSYETGQWSIRGLRPKSKTAWGHPTYRP
jgi:hypothetical protein